MSLELVKDFAKPCVNVDFNVSWKIKLSDIKGSYDLFKLVTKLWRPIWTIGAFKGFPLKD